MKVRISSAKKVSILARLEALLAGSILTVSTAYAATVCPLYWTQLQLEAELRGRREMAIAQLDSNVPEAGRLNNVATRTPQVERSFGEVAQSALHRPAAN